MKHQLSIVKSSLAAALLLFVGAGAAQAQTQTDTQKVYFAEPGSTTGVATYQRSLGNEFTVDVIYEDNVADRSVVSFNVHWDDSAAEFGGVVANSIKAVEDRDPDACKTGNPATVPAAVTTAAGNTKIVFSTLPSGAAVTTEEGDDGDTDTDRSVNPTWAQICGDVFDLASGAKTKLVTLKFTVKDVENFTSTKFGLSQAHGGDFAVAAFEGTALTITPQTFNLDVDASSRVSGTDAILIARYLAGGRDNIANAVLERNLRSATGKADDIKAVLSAGIDVLDVDASGRVSGTDAILIARYLAGGRDNIANVVLERNLRSAAGNGDAIKAAIAALL